MRIKPSAVPDVRAKRSRILAGRRGSGGKPLPSANQSSGQTVLLPRPVTGLLLAEFASVD